jgi:hypothetical protein
MIPAPRRAAPRDRVAAFLDIVVQFTKRAAGGLFTISEPTAERGVAFSSEQRA